MRNVILLIAVSMLAVGCENISGSAPVMMRNARTGQTTQCGPFPKLTSTDAQQAFARERACVEDYQRQGFERVPTAP